VLPLLIYITLSFPGEHPVAAYIFFLFFPSFLSFVFPSITCFRRQFLCNVTNPVSLHSFYSVGYFCPP